ncbi:type I-B CRISPR-associated protein Cas5b [Acanthopleuribacter pedis]|uniref:Type I-B CRISPR-associated protein Cas5 n=1 Tax=Acanthopleuribacter pedis TaxID=442870 RepID=A0A8J7Q3D2_9BACT|nr:type I-B CRISPR-associated protein Cas5b [Acanthopleuribacter pedis]MBO1318510.1 type I-B CRISPR-associated protein Cas5 [Acanthopleuribacter pedis]
MEPLTPGTKVLQVQFSADYGFFRNPQTTMSPRTLPLPSPTAVRGMLGAICGTPREQAPERFAAARLALQLTNPLRRQSIGINYLKTTSPKHFARFKEHKPTSVELLVKPAFRLFLAWDDTAAYEELKHMLVNHLSVYTPCFGSSEYLANFRWIGEETVVSVAEKEAAIHTAVPRRAVKQLDYDCGEIFTTTLPVAMNNRREVQRFETCVFERNGEPLKGTFAEVTTLSSGAAIVFI